MKAFLKIIGLLAFIAILAVASFIGKTASKAVISAEDRQRFIEEAEAQIRGNVKLPQKINEKTTLVSINVDKDKGIIIATYDIKGSITGDLKTVEAELQAMILKEACVKPNIKHILSQGIRLNYIYNFEENKKVIHNYLDQKSCGAVNE